MSPRAVTLLPAAVAQGVGGVLVASAAQSCGERDVSQDLLSRTKGTFLERPADIIRDGRVGVSEGPSRMAG